MSTKLSQTGIYLQILARFCVRMTITTYVRVWAFLIVPFDKTNVFF